jgi:uncharacterized protein (DUF1697 family)
MNSFVAFLRGINVGGHKRINMARLREACESLGLQNVRTLLASGNVLFESRKSDMPAMSKALEAEIKKAFELDVGVILCTRAELEKLAAADPFRGIPVTPRTRLFVTFLPKKPHSALKIPYVSPDGSFRILNVHDRAVCSVLTLGPQWAKNLRQMDILEKVYGRRITTRSWSTVCKCCQSRV